MKQKLTLVVDHTPKPAVEITCKCPSCRELAEKHPTESIYTDEELMMLTKIVMRIFGAAGYIR